MKNNSKLFVISAPSGAGKTTLVRAIVDRLHSTMSLRRVVACTTKQPRPGEQRGIDYHYIGVAEFERRIEANYFAEWSNAYGHYYGTPFTIVDDLTCGISPIVIVDRAGARQLKKIVPDTVLVWIEPPSIEVLKERLLQRGTETAEQMTRRLSLARQELAQEKEERLYDHHLQNDLLDEAIRGLERIIMAELSAISGSKTWLASCGMEPKDAHIEK